MKEIFRSSIFRKPWHDANVEDRREDLMIDGRGIAFIIDHPENLLYKQSDIYHFLKSHSDYDVVNTEQKRLIMDSYARQNPNCPIAKDFRRVLDKIDPVCGAPDDRDYFDTLEG